MTKEAVELPETTDRECTVCGATVAAWPEVMVCHCQTVPWRRLNSTRTVPQVAEQLGDERLKLISDLRRLKAVIAAHYPPLDSEATFHRWDLETLGQAITALRGSVPGRDEVEAEVDALQLHYVISAWAFAHNIDGAARNELLARIAALKSPAPSEDQGEG